MTKHHRLSLLLGCGALLVFGPSCYYHRHVRTTAKAGFVDRTTWFLFIPVYEELLWCEPPQVQRPVATCYPVAEGVSGEAVPVAAPAARPATDAPRACETAAECKQGEVCEAGSLGWKHCTTGP